MAGLFSFTAGWQRLWTGRAEQGDKESQQQRSALQTLRHLANRPRRESWREQQSTHSPGLPSSRLNCASRGYRDTVGHEYSPREHWQGLRAHKDERPPSWTRWNKSNKREGARAGERLGRVATGSKTEMADVTSASESKRACPEAKATSVPQVEVPTWLFLALRSRASKERLPLVTWKGCLLSSVQACNRGRRHTSSHRVQGPSPPLRRLAVSTSAFL